MAVNSVRRRENILGLLYVSALFISITAVCCILLFLFNTNYNSFNQKKQLKEEMARSRRYIHEQQKVLPLVEDLYSKIGIYDPGINAHYEKDNINYLLNELRKIYDDNPRDTRYRAFLHLASFYEMWYGDKKILWSMNENIRRTKGYLQDCELGITTKKGELSGR